MTEATITAKPQKTKSAGELFIVDNAAEWTVRRYLHEWCEIASAFDIATGYFEIGALLSLEENWQKLEKIRLLMGDEVSLRTRSAFEKGLAQIAERLDHSLEKEKEEKQFHLCRTKQQYRAKPTHSSGSGRTSGMVRTVLG